MLKKIILPFVFILISTLALISCSSNIDYEYVRSNNSSERIKFLVMHYTAENYQGSLTDLVEKGHGVSSHYLIPESNDASYGDNELQIKQLVKESARAWHAGNSFWQGRSDVNDQSIGIEIVNVPECKQPTQNNIALGRGKDKSGDQICFYPDYDPVQIQLLIKLAKDILARNPDISPTHVIGHSDIAPARKNDPGPRFPWYQLYTQGIGAWYDKETVTKYWNKFITKQLPNIGLIQKALRNYGYRVIESGEYDQQTKNVISAFQMHFIPWQVTGRADEKTTAILFALLDKYFPKKTQKLLARYQQELTPKPVIVTAIKKGQIDEVFPTKQRSNRELVNDRAIFKSYRRRGEIIINNNNATSADIFVNGQKLNIAEPLLPYNSYRYSLKKRTKTGDNTLRVENVLPQNATFNIIIPYPTLIDNSQHWRNINRFKKVDALIQQDVADGFPGAVLVVIKDGKIIKNSAYGYARKFADGGQLLAEPIKMTTDSLFDIASNTKMFATNFALMKLVSEGKIDVNKAIVDYLPLYRGAGRETRLVKDILTHNAGYAPQVLFFTHNNKLGEQFFSQNAVKTKQLILTKVPFAVGRHSKRMYSDTDYMLLGMLIERLTGMPLDTYVENNIYHPLHLENTMFNPLQKGFVKNQIAATEIQGNTRGGRVDFENVRHYVLQGEVHDEKAYYSLGGVAGHAGLFTSAKELAVLAQTLLNRGGYGKTQLFKPSVIDQFIKPDDGDGSYGLGWRRADNGVRTWQFGPYASPSAFGHTGWTGTVTVIDPEHDLAIILLTNARHSKVEGDDKNYHFKGKKFETGKYGSVVSLVYEAVLEH
ncbi:MAG: penicillin binding protein PBP4B [Gammaproteobacteria bacterium]|nr:MAG: penicillin binding protein PBP4B [Gammaproteobacteria bacterium]